MGGRPGVVIWGASGHAMVVADIIRLCGEYEIAGFLDDYNPDRRGEAFCGSTVLGGREALDELREQGIRHVIGGFGHCKGRLAAADYARSRGFELAKAIHPSAAVAPGVSVGGGTVVAAGAVICTACEIGDNVIVNTCASVDHEGVVEDGVHICPGTHLAGGVRVGRGAWIGVGATVSDHLSIGAGSLIGAGAVVVRDLPENVVAYGVPARIVRQVGEGE